MVRTPFHLSTATEHPPSLVQQRTLNNLDGIFRSYKIPHIDSTFITIHVERYNTWKKCDVLDPRNRIKLLWDDNGRSIPNPTLDDVRSKLDKKWMLSDVGVLSILSFILLY